MNTGKTPKGTKTKNRIIESAKNLISEKGVENTTLVEICSLSNVAQGTFYHYFKSINDILYEILRIEGEELLIFLNSIEGASSKQKLRKILDFQMDYYQKKGKAVVAQIIGNEFVPYAGDSLLEKLLPIRTIVKNIIAAGQENGEFSNKLTTDMYSTVIISLLFSYSFLWIRAESETSLKDLASLHVEQLINELLID